MDSLDSVAAWYAMGLGGGTDQNPPKAVQLATAFLMHRITHLEALSASGLWEHHRERTEGARLAVCCGARPETRLDSTSPRWPLRAPAFGG